MGRTYSYAESHVYSLLRFSFFSVLFSIQSLLFFTGQYCFLHSVKTKYSLPLFYPFFRSVSYSCLRDPPVLLFFSIAFSIRSLYYSVKTWDGQTTLTVQTIPFTVTFTRSSGSSFFQYCFIIQSSQITPRSSLPLFFSIAFSIQFLPITCVKTKSSFPLF